MPARFAARGLSAWSGDPPSIPSIIPQRAPLLLVDSVLAMRGGDSPAVAASLQITGDEPVLAGHFPGRAIWPGSYTIEGLAQTCALLGGLARQPGESPATLAMVAAVKVKLISSVEPPARLEYFAERVTQVGDVTRFAVEAWVGQREIASGHIDVVITEARP